MTTIKVDTKLSTNATATLDSLAGHLFRNPGVRIVGVVELAAIERTEPAPDEDKEASVKLGIKALEIGGGDHEHNLRDAMRAMYALRTATGTLDEDNSVELSEHTMRLVGARVGDIEAARLHVAINSWRQYARQAQTGDLTREQLLKELKTIADGLGAALTGAGV